MPCMQSYNCNWQFCNVRRLLCIIRKDYAMDECLKQCIFVIEEMPLLWTNRKLNIAMAGNVNLHNHDSDISWSPRRLKSRTTCYLFNNLLGLTKKKERIPTLSYHLPFSAVIATTCNTAAVVSLILPLIISCGQIACFYLLYRWRDYGSNIPTDTMKGTARR